MLYSKHQQQCLQIQVNQDVPSTSVAHFVQLAVNCSTVAPDMLSAAIDQLPAQLEPDVACTLLLTAIKRQHAAAAVYMLGVSSSTCHMDRKPREVVFIELTVHQVHLLGPQQQRKVLSLAFQLSAKALAWVVLKSVQDDNAVSTRLLCKLPAAQRFGSGLLAQLLQAAAQRNSLECAAALCMLPAVRGISADAVEQLLQAAVKEDKLQLVRLLCRVPAAAADISSRALEKTLQTAVSQQRSSTSVSCTEQLCSLPGASNLSTDDKEQLLQAAEEQQNVVCTQHLCRLPAAAQLDSAQVLQLLQAAMRHNDADHSSSPCVLTHSWSPEQHGSGGCVAQLCTLLAPQYLGDAELARLADAASTQGCAKCAEQLREFDVACQLRTSTAELDKQLRLKLHLNFGE
ncbi:hypothetical protein COO60DRAFT_274159 [Scenedesmus sp. NREL 46B-D3]|nr:hypothetical protein COO60DRAFT_274159 [Scenedesmus sp. NREL 46B-D3]